MRWLEPIRRRLTASSLLLLALLFPQRLSAHEIPADVTVIAFVKAEGQKLRLLVRAPLDAMRDVQFPTVGVDFLDFERADPYLRDAAQLWILQAVRVREDGRELGGQIRAVRASVPSDAAFNSWEFASDHMTGERLPNSVQLPWRQAMIDVLIEYPIRSEAARFSIEPTFARLGLRTQTVIRYITPANDERVLHFLGDPGTVHLDPSWWQAAFTFTRLGFLHILGGIDHLLFVLCLLIPFRKLRPLILIVTAFTVAHSITLIASALGWAPSALWFPPLVETLIAASILYMALENIVGARVERRWAIAFGFGLIHGFGFSFALRDSLQLAGSHSAVSLLSFNLGVELGQVAVVALAIPAFDLLFRRVVAERLGTIIVSAFIAHTAWHWFTERAGALAEYRIEGSFNALALTRILLMLLVAGGAAWLVYELYQRFRPPAKTTV